MQHELTLQAFGMMSPRLHCVVTRSHVGETVSSSFAEVEREASRGSNLGTVRLRVGRKSGS